MKPWSLGLILLALIVLPNVLAYVLVRQAGRTPPRFWQGFARTLRHPFHQEDDALDELRRRAEEIGAQHER